MVMTGVVDIMNYIHVMFYFEDITLEPYFFDLDSYSLLHIELVFYSCVTFCKTACYHVTY